MKIIAFKQISNNKELIYTKKQEKVSLNLTSKSIYYMKLQKFSQVNGEIC